MKQGWMLCRGVLAGLLLGAALAGAVELPGPEDPQGFVARLLINEVPFPGERGYRSEVDSKAAMEQVAWVLLSRLSHVPAGYSQPQVASVRARNLLDVITAGGVHGQVDGFYRDGQGRLRTVPRVEERLRYLQSIAGQGQPGRFARLLAHGRDLARWSLGGEGIAEDRFRTLHRIREKPVTGRAFSWMTDEHYYHPGGAFVRIPDGRQGSLGGNRFFTLLKP
jgi:hypothetical protein